MIKEINNMMTKENKEMVNQSQMQPFSMAGSVFDKSVMSNKSRMSKSPYGGATPSKAKTPIK